MTLGAMGGRGVAVGAGVEVGRGVGVGRGPARSQAREATSINVKTAQARETDLLDMRRLLLL
jgi:hypothetical protein